MKRAPVILFLAASLIPLFSAAQSKNYTVRGTVADHSMDGSYLTFSRFVLPGMDSLRQSDSVKIENRSFTFCSVADEPHMVLVGDGRRIWARFIAEPGDIRIAFDPTKAYLRNTVSGTRINNEYQKMIVSPINAFYSLQGPLDEKRDAGLKAGTWTSVDEDAYEDASPDFRLFERAKAGERAFMAKYIGTPDVVIDMLAFSLMEQVVRKRMNPGNDTPSRYAQENDALILKLPQEKREELTAAMDYWDKGFVAMMKERAERKDAPQLPKIIEIVPEPVQVGKPFSDFSAETADGKPFSLGETVAKSKLVMLDFWASWCIPCMKMMPEVAALHEKYKSKGLSIVGISSDSKEEPWRKAMERAGMVWTQVRSDGKDAVGSTYGIRTIPYTILIDRDGNIVARALRGQELEEKIAELLK